ncbi:MAG TPA: hypothetical protein ENI57_04715 [Ignavibacteria bacterium]|mgnify:CR=1 FL=1|nr:hypothetical protein [Ignavibacteria bacterium]
MKITKPHRISRTYKQKIKAKPSLVFPLLCPNREVDWVNGWLPEEIISNSGLAELDCVFTTTNDKGKAFWIVTKYEPENFMLEIAKIVPDYYLSNIRISINDNQDNGSDLSVTYQLTSLSKNGNKKVDEFTEEYYKDFMEAWERELNYFLITGHKKEDK